MKAAIYDPWPLLEMVAKTKATSERYAEEQRQLAPYIQEAEATKPSIPTGRGPWSYAR